ncbi:dienelactone hydrolase family protein [Chitinilyticum piscinae]|uniref:Dienelactone hydrolase family protein n=1 Tax=Chitinilyticum piscinae TaxID=2866724 RepID=A0A8J7FP66_9NEIS|nr:dienelactone hydrolase family protein [Chitinilyticum piscinae]MBE9609674.1 dienelactone hydrolase family protein [Chitinilyticum piscinae]
MRVLLCLLGLLLLLPARAAPVSIPAGNIVLKGEYYPPVGQTHVLAPAIVLLHGCGGFYGRDGKVGERFLQMKDLLQELGYAVLLLDSYSARKVRNACTAAGSRSAPSSGIRANDAQHALSWLNARREVDGSRLGVLGWGQGGTVALKLLARTNPGLKAAVTFDADCARVRVGRDYQVGAPTLVLVSDQPRRANGLKACRKLAEITRQDLFHVVPVGDRGAISAQADLANAAAAPDAGSDAYRRTFKWFSRWFDPARGIVGAPPRHAAD